MAQNLAHYLDTLMHFHVLSFAGPAPYAKAGGIASRLTGLSEALAEAGFETHPRQNELPEVLVDRWGRTHDVPNLWIVGSNVFSTNATANPTLAIAALTLRTAAAMHRHR